MNNIKEYFLKHPYIAFIIKYSVISIIAIVAVALLGDPIDNLNRLFIPVFLFVQFIGRGSYINKKVVMNKKVRSIIWEKGRI